MDGIRCAGATFLADDPDESLRTEEHAENLATLAVQKGLVVQKTPPFPSGSRPMGLEDIRDLAVFIVNRPRHDSLIVDVRKAGARVVLRGGGDVGGSLLAADARAGIDLMLGVGGAAEGLLAACAVKALGGAMLARVEPNDAAEKQACLDAGMDLARVLTTDDLIKGDEVFFSATGVTESAMLSGVRLFGDTAETQSLVLRYETGTRRFMATEHRLR